MNALLPKSPNLRGSTKEKKVYRWHHEFGSCVLTGYKPFELAHVSGVEDGKGIGRKGPLEYILPLRKELHMIEELGRAWFWRCAGIDDEHENRRDYARNMFSCIETGDLLQYENLIGDIQYKANRSFIKDCLNMRTMELQEKWK